VIRFSGIRKKPLTFNEADVNVNAWKAVLNIINEIIYLRSISMEKEGCKIR
jgi:hypothetical protein